MWIPCSPAASAGRPLECRSVRAFVYKHSFLLLRVHKEEGTHGGLVREGTVCLVMKHVPGEAAS